jgi:ABC-type lipoprotein export system ATPase subunit
MNGGGTQLSDVSVQFRTPSGVVAALTEVTIEFAPASSTAIVGRSGSGKSTLVSVLALLRRPTSGTVRVGAEDTSVLGDDQLSRLRGRLVGTVFQSFHLDPAFSAADNVLLPWHFGAAVVVVTHDTAIAAQADRLVRISQGRIHDDDACGGPGTSKTAA